MKDIEKIFDQIDPKSLKMLLDVDYGLIELYETHRQQLPDLTVQFCKGSRVIFTVRSCNLKLHFDSANDVIAYLNLTVKGLAL